MNIVEATKILYLSNSGEVGVKLNGSFKRADILTKECTGITIFAKDDAIPEAQGICRKSCPANIKAMCSQMSDLGVATLYAKPETGYKGKITTRTYIPSSPGVIAHMEYGLKEVSGHSVTPEELAMKVATTAPCLAGKQ